MQSAGAGGRSNSAVYSKDPDGNGPAADIGQVEGGILAWHKDRQLLDTDGCAAVKNQRAMQEALPIHDSAKKRKWTTRRTPRCRRRMGLQRASPDNLKGSLRIARIGGSIQLGKSTKNRTNSAE